MKRSIFILIGCVMLGSVSNAQGYDPMLTMYHYQPLNINPAYTGNMDSKWRMHAVYREQGYIVSRPYRAFQSSFDMNLPINAWGGNIWGAGISVVNDDQGDAYLVNRRINLNFALGQYLDPRQEHSISVGFQGGLGTRAIDYGDTYWDVQWVGEGFQRDAPSGEPLITDVNTYMDLSTGVQYTYMTDGLVDMSGGISMYHINTPDNSLYFDTAGFDLKRRWNVHYEFEHRIRNGSMFATKPSVLYSRQHNRANLMIGNQFKFLFTEGTRSTGKRNESSMTLGLYGRFGKQVYDALGTITFEFAGFTFGAGYDIPLGSFNSVNGFEGAFEFMLGYRAGYRRGLYNKYSPHRKGKL